MERTAKGAIEVEAELNVLNAQVQLVHYRFAEPPSSMLRVENRFRLELSLTSRHRSARGCFREHWGARRFERIGDVFMLPPSMDMLAQSDEDESISSIVCSLEAESVIAMYDTLPELTEEHLLASLDVRDTKVKALLLRLAEEARCPGFASQLLVESITVQMKIELLRLGKAMSDRQAYGGLAPWQLRLIDERLKDVREAPTLPVLAELCRISVRQLTRSFRVSRGSSIGAYVAGSQMEHAKRLLAADQSVTSIASALGFSSSSNFCFAFRRATGTTPGLFRQTLLRRH
jgi:AraC family transcriptional regulator